MFTYQTQSCRSGRMREVDLQRGMTPPDGGRQNQGTLLIDIGRQVAGSIEHLHQLFGGRGLTILEILRLESDDLPGSIVYADDERISIRNPIRLHSFSTIPSWSNGASRGAVPIIVCCTPGSSCRGAVSRWVPIRMNTGARSPSRR